jgi:hypothetical protein
MSSTLSQLVDEVLGFIHRPELEQFDSLAMRIFDYQRRAVPAYREYCGQLGIGPDGATLPADIPFVSTIAFKYVMLAAKGAAETRGACEFLTSGTTSGAERRGRHLVQYPEVYRASALAHLRAMLFCDLPEGARMRILAMHPTAERMAESSLSAMITWCIEEFGEPKSRCVADRERVDIDAAVAYLREAAAMHAPVCVLGTTAGFAALFERVKESRERFILGPGSRMMDTGGPKGQRVPLAPGEVAARAAGLLGIAEDLVINEYGMTELCSQLYDATRFNSEFATASGERVKLAPPWMRPAAIDPATMRRLPDGTPGMLAFIDLANVCSVAAVMTEDIGIVEGKRVRLFGRARASDARGCALSIEMFAAAASR